jgi:two-component system sensor histidine kinase ChiS
MLRYLCLIALIFLISCLQKQPDSALHPPQPHIFAAKGYQVPQDSIELPSLIPVDETKLKKIPQAKLKKFPAFSNEKTVPEPKSYAEIKPVTCTPGQYGINMPRQVRPNSKPFPAGQPVPVAARPMFMRDNANCKIQYLDVGQGLNSSLIWCLTKDKPGNLWMGTYGGGLVRYDGKSLTHFTLKDGLSTLYLSAVFCDTKGNIWYGNSDNEGGVGRFDGHTFLNFNQQDGLCFGRVNSIMEDKKGNMWFASDSGLSKYDGNHFTTYYKEHGLVNNDVNCISEDQSGNVWLGTVNGISCFNGSSFQSFSKSSGFPAENISSIFFDKKGIMWLGSNEGVLSYDGHRFSQIVSSKEFENNKIWSIISDDSGRLWIATFGRGIFCLDGKQLKHYSREQGLSNPFVIALLEEKAGGIWFGTNGGGLGRLDAASFLHFEQSAGIEDPYVYDIHEDRNGKFWIATNTSGVYSFDGKYMTHHVVKDWEFNHRFLEDRMGNLWTAHELGVSCFNGSEYTLFTETEGLCKGRIWSMLEDRAGNIWLGSEDGGGASKYDGKSFKTYSEKSGLSSGRVWSILEDKFGNIWFGTAGGGLNKYNGKSFTHYKLQGNPGCNNIICMKETSSGDILIGTDGGGLFIFDGKTFTNYTEREGLSFNHIWSIEEDAKHNLWLGTDKGLNCLIPTVKNDKNQTSYQIRIFHIEDGLKAEDFVVNSVCLDSKNRIWWGTGKALTQLDLNKFEVQSALQPEAQLGQLNLDGQFVDFRKLALAQHDSIWKDIHFSGVDAFHNFPKDLILPHTINHLTFFLKAIDWSSPEQVKYRFRLNGRESNWSIPGSENKADYRDIPPGKYTFMVQASCNSEKWGRTYEYSFEILPPWWSTWWAITFYVLLGFGSILFFLRWRESALRARQKELVVKVDEATFQIRKQKEFVEEQKQFVEIKNREILDSIEYAKRIQTAVLPPLRLINEILKNSFILYLPKDIVAGDFYWLETVNEMVYFAACDCTGHGVPGAMVSVVCNNALNRALIEFGEREPGKIFDRTRNLVLENFSKSDE